jgi:hypothetical protein
MRSLVRPRLIETLAIPSQDDVTQSHGVRSTANGQHPPEKET